MVRADPPIPRIFPPQRARASLSSYFSTARLSGGRDSRRGRGHDALCADDRLGRARHQLHGDRVERQFGARRRDLPNPARPRTLHAGARPAATMRRREPIAAASPGACLRNRRCDVPPLTRARPGRAGPGGGAGGGGALSCRHAAPPPLRPPRPLDRPPEFLAGPAAPPMDRRQPRCADPGRASLRSSISTPRPTLRRARR